MPRFFPSYYFCVLPKTHEGRGRSVIVSALGFVACFSMTQISGPAQTVVQHETRAERYARFHREPTNQPLTNPAPAVADTAVAYGTVSPLMGVSTSSPPYGPDRILIQPRRGTGVAALADFHAARGARVLRTFERLGGLQVVSVPAGETVPGLVAKYAQSGLVEFAEPDYTAQISATLPNDPYFTNGLLWELYNFGQNGGTPHADIDAIDAWDVLTSASNIVVAVLDTGVRYTHQDLASNMWVNPVDGGHGFNALVPTNTPLDDNGHGTLVSGVLGAVGNNGLGVTGVAWQVQIMACKCFNSGGTGTNSDIISCIDYAISNGARIINASFSGTSNSLAMSNAIVSAQEAGIIFVAAAGNGPPEVNLDASPTYPACYNIDNIVSVEYTTRTDALGPLSNYGATNVDLAAPGDMVYSTFYASDSSYYPPTGLGISIAGTSFAAAYVSGSFALMLAKYPAENYQQIISRVLNATDPRPALAGKCLTGGRLNLRKALSPPLVLTADPPVPSQPFKLHLSAGPRRSCVILGSPDFQAWTPVYTNATADDGTFDFSDPASTNAAARYYRAESAL
jgi:subtilisin family serine protease